MKDDTHTCSYYCDRPECIKAQRDEFRDQFKKRWLRVIDDQIGTWTDISLRHHTIVFYDHSSTKD